MLKNLTINQNKLIILAGDLNLFSKLSCVKSVQIPSFFWIIFSSIFSLNTEKYEPEKTPYFEIFYAVVIGSCANLKKGKKTVAKFIELKKCVRYF